MTQLLSPSAQKVQDALKALGLTNEVVELPETTRSATEAATAIGCQVGQIAKSLIFKSKNTGKAALVIISGENQVNEKRLAEHLGGPIERADADFVRQKTGFVIGGVPPVGHSEKLTTFIDKDLLQLPEIWAAAGTPNAVFRLSPTDLVRITAGQVVSVT